MKSIIYISFLFIFTHAPAVCYAEDMAHLYDLDYIAPSHIVNKIRNNNNLNFCIKLDDKTIADIIRNDVAKGSINVEEIDEKIARATEPYYNLIGNLARNAFKEWTAGTAKKIRDADRADEFQDILPILEKDFQINIEPCQYDKTYDLGLIVEDIPDGRAHFLRTGYMNNKTPEIHLHRKRLKPQANKSRMADNKITMIHEMGHYFGLGDRYKITNSSMVYATLKIRPSVMDVSRDIKCDDVDGIITLMDVFTILKEPFTASAGTVLSL